jgi:hypothetical protein
LQALISGFFLRCTCRYRLALPRLARLFPQWVKNRRKQPEINGMPIGRTINVIFGFS